MRQCGICAACMLRRMSVHAAGESEDQKGYVWENLQTPELEKGVAAAFDLRKPRGAFFEYAIAGTLHPDHLASLRHSPLNQPALHRKIAQFSRTLTLPEGDTRKRLDRMLAQHDDERRGMIKTLAER